MSRNTTTVVRDWHMDDVEAGYAVWNAALGTSWPLKEAAFRERASEGVVALRDGQMLGFALVDSSRELPAIIALCVRPEVQGHGIGTALHDAAIATLHGAGLRRIGLGAGRHYFWPGVPLNLAGARTFFARRGWLSEETTWDLVSRDLHDFQPPQNVVERGRDAAVECRCARTEERDAVLLFEEEHFRSGHRTFAASPKRHG